MKRYLFPILFLLFYACGIGEPVSGATNFIWRNSSNYKIHLKSYVLDELVYEFVLDLDEEEIRRLPSESGSNNGPRYATRFEGNDSVQLIFNDSILINFDRGHIEGNPMWIENYELIEDSVEPYVFLFEFTNEDYKRAVVRGRVIK